LRMIRHLLSLTALAAALSSTFAVAGDLGGYEHHSLKDEPYIAPAAFTWTGFYVGANAGYGWSSEDWSLLQCNCAGMGGAAGMGGSIPSHHADGDGLLP
jgi:opacity protein-like surface antigen